MTVHLVTFSDDKMTRSMDLCRESASRHGVEYDHPWYAGSILHWLGGTHSEIFRQPENPSRAWGWWAWKPLIIHRELRTAMNGDIVVYSDAGVEFINNVSHIIERMDQDIFLFGNNWEHAHWCKRDVVETIWPAPSFKHEERAARIAALEQAGRSDILEIVDDMLTGYVSDAQVNEILWANFGKQVQASVIFFRVSDYTRKFVAEWLKWCLFESGRLIDDSPSRAPNHPEFQEHRHDQAILTTLAYREGVPLHYWPAVYNKGGSPEFVYEKLPEYAGDDFPILFHHHRRRDHEWQITA